MFYSQFILAKKGPLGTIWIAAHLERKLRKNQVADTDIGVSVDSILFPEAPIALRLSSHLLLGVVRIYSRKVNYLFDDCSEALLKIKHAFRSTAVDLPPEESTAPYHSITLPETFDLDDFELPDSDLLQGNYVDHHVSTREQITLQDNMEAVVYSTTQFGLDERFGDGDTSGLDLDEEIFLNNVAAPGLTVIPASGAERHASVQQMPPLEPEKNQDEINGSSELEDLAGSTDFIEYAQAPSTPGLVEEPNLSKNQEASACDDQLELGEEPNLSNIQEASGFENNLESEVHNITNFATEVNVTNITSSSDLNRGNENAVSCSLTDDMNPVTVLGGQEINQLKSLGDYTPSTAGDTLLAQPVNTTFPGSEFPDSNFSPFDGINGLADLRKEVESTNGVHSIDGAHGIELQGADLDETVSCLSSSHKVHLLEDPVGNLCTVIKHNSEKPCLSGTHQSGVPECVLDTNLTDTEQVVPNNVESAGNMEKSCPLSFSVASNIESPGTTQDLDIPEKTQACQDSKDSKILNPIVDENLEADGMHVLRPCKHLNQLSMLIPERDVSLGPHLPPGVIELCLTETSGGKRVPHAPEVSTDFQGDGCDETDFMKQGLEENQTTEPALCADISKLNDHVDNGIATDTRLEDIDRSENSELPAPEKLLAVPEGLSDLQDNLLVDSTLGKAHLVSGDGGDAVTNTISGKKRSFSESTLTVQSLTSVESLGVDRSKRTKESVPDDDDLLSSILVGRRSSVLKMKLTPSPPLDIRSMKRPRSASRFGASKRKVLMDDSMVLHGDVIRQQLTNTEDIRRLRKKAPCTGPEIWMIQKEFLEDEIFCEPILTGLSRGLAFLHSQMSDLSEIRVSQNDAHNPSPESAANLNFSLQKAVTKTLEAASDTEFSVDPIVHKETETEGINKCIVDSNVVEAEPPVNQQGEDPVLGSHCYETQMQIETILDRPQPQSLSHEPSMGMPEKDIHGASHLAVDAVNPDIDLGVESASLRKNALVDKNIMPADSIVQSAFLDNESAGVSTDQKLDGESVEMKASLASVSGGKGDNAIKIAEEKYDSAAVSGTESRPRDELLLVETDAGASVEIDVDMHTECYAHARDENPSLAISTETYELSNHIVVPSGQALEEVSVLNENEVLATELDDDRINTTSYGSGEEPELASSCPVELNIDIKYLSSDDGEHPGCRKADPQCILDAEMAATDHIATVDHGDFDYTMDGHDTGFLNADDDDVIEEDEDSMPSVGQTSFLENSGWSSRTRAVAKYLKVLFDKEAEHGRKILPMDNLLVGKTRKEASRMFFEALVLKTRDYINVEQGAPFDSINMKARVMLMKSDF